MAYLDKDGIPRVSEGIQRHNNSISEVIDRLNAVQLQLIDAINEMPDDKLKEDTELAEHLYLCQVHLEKCKDRCRYYYLF